jgi:DNA-binding NtrC family response regulator
MNILDKITVLGFDIKSLDGRVKMPTNVGTILVVDDDSTNRTLLSTSLEEKGHSVEMVEDGLQALERLRTRPFDVVLLDLLMPKMDGFQVLEKMKADNTLRHVPVIVISAVDEMESVIRCIEMGATDHLPKPFDSVLLHARINALLIAKRLHDQELEYLQNVTRLTDAAAAVEAETFDPESLAEVAARSDALGQLARVFQGMAHEVYAREQHLKHQVQEASKDRYKLGDIIGRSPAMQDVYQSIINAAASDANVVICGESGTGKELVAQTIHQLSKRREKAFVPVNCGAIPEALFEREFFGHRKGTFTGADRDKPGLFDVAHGGTLFLDEIGELPLLMQVKLLRALQSGEYTPVGNQKVRQVDVRIIAATNKNLVEQRKQGLIRDDFFTGSMSSRSICPRYGIVKKTFLY